MTPLLWWSLGVLGYAGMGIGVTASLNLPSAFPLRDTKLEALAYGVVVAAWPAMMVFILAVNILAPLGMCARWLSQVMNR